MIDSRAWAKPALPSVHTPSSSGPRCRRGAIIRHSRASSSAPFGAAPAVTKPAIPHISRLYSLSQGSCRIIAAENRALRRWREPRPLAAASRLGFSRLGERLGHVEELLANDRVGNSVIKSDKLDRLRPLKVLAPALILGTDLRVVGPQIAKKVRDGHAQDLGHCRKSGCADSVRATLVFLHLLKGQAERVGKGFLIHPEQQPAHPDTVADMNVDRVRDAGAAPVFRRRFGLVHGSCRVLQRTPLAVADLITLHRVPRKRKQHSTIRGKPRARAEPDVSPG